MEDLVFFNMLAVHHISVELVEVVVEAAEGVF